MHDYKEGFELGEICWIFESYDIANTVIHWLKCEGSKMILVARERYATCWTELSTINVASNLDALSDLLCEIVVLS